MSTCALMRAASERLDGLFSVGVGLGKDELRPGFRAGQAADAVVEQ
jgi:hypothetical protein